MATKAELFRYQAERSGPKKAKHVAKVHHLDRAHTDTRNVTKWADRNASAAMEDSLSGRPSRKSTRPSSHHGRNDTQLIKAVRAALETSGSRAARAKLARR
jgi:hypothetical protein